ISWKRNESEESDSTNDSHCQSRISEEIPKIENVLYEENTSVSLVCKTGNPTSITNRSNTDTSPNLTILQNVIVSNSLK
ncbi:hypothetical protein ILUMI_20176, partial [Ignelater luminosus]